MLGQSLVANTVTAGRGVVGEQVYSVPGTYVFVVPDYVTSLSVVCVAGGGGGILDSQGRPVGGAGGSLAYANGVNVVPGEEIEVVVGAGGQPVNNVNRNGENSKFGSFCEAGNAFEGVIVGDGGGKGGEGDAGGGGAGGYSGPGGAGGGAPEDGDGGGGGGGGTQLFGSGSGGGGVGLFGEGPSGAGSNSGGTGGSGGEDASGPAGGAYGGGSSANSNGGAAGASGAVRVVWPGAVRVFPNGGVQEITE